MNKEEEKKEEVKKILLATGLTAAAIIAGAHLLKKRPIARMKRPKPEAPKAKTEVKPKPSTGNARFKKVVGKVIYKTKKEKFEKGSGQSYETHGKGNGFHF